jgi:uncharacterized protein
MSHVADDLHAHFPAQAETLHRLKTGDAAFRAAAERYRDLNREIHRIEAEIEAASAERLEELKKQRLALLDDMADRIGAATPL